MSGMYSRFTMPRVFLAIQQRDKILSYNHAFSILCDYLWSDEKDSMEVGD